MEGMRRFAQTIGWDVETILLDGLEFGMLLGKISASGAGGCVLGPGLTLPNGREQSLDLGMPIVSIDPVKSRRGRANAVFCDNTAIAEAAFRELSSGHPSSYAAVSYWDPAQRWAMERVDAFRRLCAESRRKCSIFFQPHVETPDARMARLTSWIATLPANVAIFAANDFTAVETAIALKSRHRHIPKSATLVGVDGSPERHDIPPSPVPITSVDINFESAGFLSAKLLWEKAVAQSQRCASSKNKAIRAKSISPGNAPAVTFGPLMVVRRESTRGRGRRERFILEAAETIRREACDGLTAAALAARYPTSRKHFERQFREATGHSVLDEILYIRLEQVQAYLQRRDVAIDAIAGLCGFGSEIELRRLFRRRFGMSMTEWRNRNLV